MAQSLVQALQGIVGTEHVLIEGDLNGYLQDWRQRAGGRALAVVRPASTQQVAAVVQACAAHATAIVPQGGNTGLVLGSIPDASGRQVLLSLRRMVAVRALDRANATVTVEAGCVLQTLQEAADRAGLLFPLSLAAEGSCTIGGNLATNAGGTQVLRYGNARDLCLGLEVVTARGEVWPGLTGLRKDNTGYDLRDLFVGSEGTLGIITAATLKLYPKPLAQSTAWAAVPSLPAACALLALAQARLGAALTGFEVMGQFALSLVARHFTQHPVPLLGSAPFFVLLENSDFESESHAREQFEQLLQAAIEQGVASDAVLAENLGRARQLWHLREQIPLAQAMEGPNIKHDISIPVSSIAGFCAETDALLRREIPGVRLVNFGHLGDGNLHYNVQAPEGGDAKAFVVEHEQRVNQLVYDSVHRFDGSISAEHGVGALKVERLEQFKSPVALGLMRAVKRALDPQNLLNPGRVVRL
jgi:FAD/FMN-containing dehydrogenase